MWGFVGKATQQMEDLNDDFNAADSLFTEVVRYFGEDDKNMSSTEFYGTFKTFVTSYRVRDFVEPCHSNVSPRWGSRNAR
jgi:cytokinesis protein